MPTPSSTRLPLTEAEARQGVVPDSRRTRPLFFDGKFLTADDLNREQAYLLTRQADLARSLGFGVVSGLRVTRENPAGGAASNATHLWISAGLGLTPAGETVQLLTHREVNLADVPRLESLNAAFGLARRPQAPYFNLTGLFIVGLRAVEFTANPTPVFPPNLQGQQAVQDGEIIEATAVTLVPYDSPNGMTDPTSARSRAAREIFLDQRPPRLPSGVLPLAMVFLRSGLPEWIDEGLVRREAGDDDRFGFGFAPRSLAEAHFRHYQERLDELPAPAQPGSLAAADFLELLPPGGPLPPGAINFTDFSQAFFPADARVELTLVPEDELAGLIDESLDQPAIDLKARPEDSDALAILVLAPVPRARYRQAVGSLASLTKALRSAMPSLLGQQRPQEALKRLQEAVATKAGKSPAASGNAASLVNAAWQAAVGSSPQLWYVRRRNLPYATDLAGQPLPTSTQPAFLVGPADTTVPVGAPAAFQVSALGSGTLSYQWRKDGTDLAGKTQTTLTLPAVATTDAGEYDVVVTDPVGHKVTSSPATLTVIQPPAVAGPAVTTQPRDVTAAVGLTAQFSVVATGTAPLAFQWLKARAPLPGENAATLTLPNLQLSDAASYQVDIRNAAGSVTSSPATLTVQNQAPAQPPIITLEPGDLTTTPGSDAPFTVSVSGTAPMAFAWFRAGSPIPGETGATLTVRNVQTADARTYEVEVTNAAGTVRSRAATLTLLAAPAVSPPVINTQPVPVNAPRGAEVRFTVEVGGTAPFEFQWRRNGTDLTGQTGPTLTLPRITEANAGSYDLAVRNAAGSVFTTPALLTLVTAPAERPPVIVRQPAAVTAVAGSDVVLNVGVEGTAPFEYVWNQDGTVLPEFTGETLRRPGVAATATGAYSVTVRNGAGSVTSTPASLTVTIPPPLDPPRITGQPTSVVAATGTRVLLGVSVLGSAPFTYQWQKDGVPLTGATQATLELNPAQAAAAGQYRVVVTNAVGSDTSAAAQVTIQPAPAPQPPVITQQPVSVVAPVGASVRFSVAVTGRAPFAFEWQSGGVALPGETGPTLNLPSVRADQAGTYRVVVRNADGTVASDPVSLGVEAPPLPEAPVITRQPRGGVVPQGSTLHLTVGFTGTAPLKFEWTKDGNPISGARGATLTLPKLAAADSGTYQVQVANAVGTATSDKTSVEVEGVPVDPCAQEVARFEAVRQEMDRLKAQLQNAAGPDREQLQLKLRDQNAKLKELKLLLDTCRAANPG